VRPSLRDHAASDHLVPFRSLGLARNSGMAPPTLLSANCNSHLLGDLVAGGQAGYPQIDAQRTHFRALLVPGMIWKQWNGCIFKHAQPSISATTVLIKEEALRWAKAGAHGLKSYSADDLGCS
jgi:hypothetical protein